MRADAGAADPAKQAARGARWPVLPWLLKRVLVVAFLAAVAWLLFDHARAIDWRAVLRSARGSPLPVIVQAAALAALAHLATSGYDLIGRRHAGHTLPAWLSSAIGFVSFAFNINLGSLVGGIGLRYRLYTRLGLKLSVVTDIVVLAMLTNWLGYLLVAGAVFMASPPAFPAGWEIGSAALRAIGAALWCGVGAYLAVCAWSRRRDWWVRGRHWTLPSAPMAAAQLLMASLNWLLIGGVVTTALQGRIEFATVLGVLLLSSVAGLLAHVPAGLGVIEAVFVALLSDRLLAADLLGGLLLYRLIYYIAPLAIATALYLAIESMAARRAPAR